MCREHESVAVVAPAALPLVRQEGALNMRWIGLDVHVDFCEVAVHEQGVTRRAPRVEPSEAALRRFGEQLARTDTVVLEATGGAWSIARLLSEYAQLVVADARPLRALSRAKAKTDRADARSLAELGARGLLTPVSRRRRADANAAAAARAPRPARGPALPGEERDPRPPPPQPLALAGQ